MLFDGLSAIFRLVDFSCLCKFSCQSGPKMKFHQKDLILEDLLASSWDVEKLAASNFPPDHRVRLLCDGLLCKLGRYSNHCTDSRAGRIAIFSFFGVKMDNGRLE